ncbi:MAG: hypothetical protein RI985_562 [Chloroflexota bacterium]|jgi:5,10-methylene-tetrahydrofolate dehydrogenase/methenyl tetrahydrofolate cyclohydrolase
MQSCWTSYKTDWDACTITGKMELLAKIAFVFGVTFAIILRSSDFGTPLCTRTTTLA